MSRSGCRGLPCLDPLSSAVYGCLLIRNSCQLSLVISSRLSTRILTNQPTDDQANRLINQLLIAESLWSLELKYLCLGSLLTGIWLVSSAKGKLNELFPRYTYLQNLRFGANTRFSYESTESETMSIGVGV
jgi:hypothetical protein